jgi:GntR family transcriptional repressor for pyruvate dehydrogenase complex
MSLENPSRTTFEMLKQLKTIKKQRLYENIVAQIHNVIEKGEFQVGDKLPTERELALTFGVSRHSVREAIRTLEQQAVVKSTPGSGTFIGPGKGDSVVNFLARSILGERDKLADIFVFRRMIEPEIAYLAAQNASEDDIRDLEENLNEQQENVLNKQLYIKLDIRFHYLLAKSTGNSILARIGENINNLLSSCRDEMFYQDKKRTTNSFCAHEKIFKAVQEGDAESARALMLNHISDIETLILEKCDSQILL